MGSPPVTVTVYEPFLSTDDRKVVVKYVGYPAVEVMAWLFGSDWQSRGGTAEYRALDGYVSRIPVGRFLKDSAWLVFARADGAPFTVDNIRQNRTDVPLGPYYLVWDNIARPELLVEGAVNWPYQVMEVNLVTLSEEALFPEGLDPRHPCGRRTDQGTLPELSQGERVRGRQVRGQSRDAHQGVFAGSLFPRCPDAGVGTAGCDHAGDFRPAAGNGATAHRG